jgi:hypothetical protein
MAKAIKHVGRLVRNQRKVIVAYRVVPGEPDNCIVVQTESLMAEEHDALISAVEGSAGQEAYEFGEAMARAQLPDGRNMLAGFHTTGKMMKMKTSEIEMVPDGTTTIPLSELNQIIADQKGVTVADLALKGPDGKTKPVAETVADPTEAYTNETTTDDGVLTDEQLAAQYRSQADALFKEAKQLREQAEELVPTKKKQAKKVIEESV